MVDQSLTLVVRLFTGCEGTISEEETKWHPWNNFQRKLCHIVDDMFYIKMLIGSNDLREISTLLVLYIMHTGTCMYFTGIYTQWLLKCHGWYLFSIWKTNKPYNTIFHIINGIPFIHDMPKIQKDMSTSFWEKMGEQHFLQNKYSHSFTN